MRSAVARGLEQLNERDRAIIRARFGIDREGLTATLSELGRQFGISKERVRQLEGRALEKLRGVLGGATGLV